MTDRKIPGFVIAGTGSGCGKTTVALGIMAALAKRGYKVQPFKVGPDFIDPSHHTRATGRISRNLDGWILTREANREIFFRASRDADIAIVEGVMGLFDGKDGLSPDGSTAQMASWLGLPVFLVVDARGMGRSSAAVVHGFVSFDPDITIRWVVFNRIGSPRHLALLEEAVSSALLSVTVLGGIPKNPEVAIPERHLGLMTAEDHTPDTQVVDALASLLEEWVDIDGLLKTVGLKGPGRVCGGVRIREAPPSESQSSVTPDVEVPPADSTPRRLSARRNTPGPAPPKKIRIAIARDRAFCFYYEDNLELLRKSGAELVPFSPLSDVHLPPDISGIYLGGGYPELHAEALSVNTLLHKEIRRCALSGMPILAECGGHMYLGAGIEDSSGGFHDMAGVFPFRTRMLPRFSALGYREAVLTEDCVLGPKGTIVRGHEFHYSKIDETSYPSQETPLFRVRNGRGETLGAEGCMMKNTASSYIHLHFASNPAVSGYFVEKCEAYAGPAC